jgi:2-haloalkanoic acid dehalogenase type II
MRPALFTFDVFGTVLDWRRGLVEAAATAGVAVDDATFERIVDRQGELESGAYRTYADIVAQSLIDVCGLAPARALEIGEQAGTWPLFPDASGGLSALLRVAPCVAMTNSDRTHGEQIQRALGFRLTRWLCAQDVGVYKPSPEFWRIAGRELGVEPGPRWWHVSAYADYDLGVARELALTAVLVNRPHARRGPADLEVADLVELARRAQTEPP